MAGSPFFEFGVFPRTSEGSVVPCVSCNEFGSTAQFRRHLQVRLPPSATAPRDDNGLVSEDSTLIPTGYFWPRLDFFWTEKPGILREAGPNLGRYKNRRFVREEKDPTIY